MFELSDSLGLLLAAGEGEGDSMDEVGRREGVRGVDSAAGSTLLIISCTVLTSQSSLFTLKNTRSSKCHGTIELL